MTCWEFQAESEADTDRLAAGLSRLLPERAVIALSGTLGAGKTRFVQALAAAAGVNRLDVVSPTFVLCQHYQGKVPIHHLDTYRLRDDDEWYGLGPDDLFAARGWTVIEWADRFRHCLPDERLDIEIEVTGDQTRRFQLTGHGTELERVVAQLPAALDQDAVGRLGSTAR